MENPFLGPCHCDREAAAGAEPGACGKKEIVSAEELAALAEIRALSSRARALRAELAECAGARRRELAEELEAARAELVRCRQAWSEANELKLRRLGHRP
jgi:hypothetical protein